MHADVLIHDDGGNIEVKAAHSDLVTWANRPGASWPCSTLARCERGLIATLDRDSGDLIDLIALKPAPRFADEALENVAGDELTAFLDDALLDAAKLLLEIRKTKESLQETVERLF